MAADPRLPPGYIVTEFWDDFQHEDGEWDYHHGWRVEPDASWDESLYGPHAQDEEEAIFLFLEERAVRSWDGA